uniref:Uncharacterized protein n=1 Tax=Romanomermis culicivorax TaxID=13658 RepID=A0A915IHS4_ROMCU
MTLRCCNCQSALKFDPSITDRYPEWQNLSSLSAKPSSADVYYNKSAATSAINSSNDVNVNNASIEIAAGDRNAGQENYGNLGHSTTMMGNLFDLICNDVTAVDNPMCQECTDKLLDCMDQQMLQLEDECKEYRDFLSFLKKNVQESADLTSLKNEHQKLQAEESGLRAELARLELEEAELDKKLAQEEQELNQITDDEEALWKSYRDINRQILTLSDENESLSNQLRYANDQLEKLQKTNAFNLTFHIWHRGHFGTINGFRLGRLPSELVEWSEINAAWGQAVLLLHCLARKIGLKFKNYELVPYGNHSFVKVTSSPSGNETPDVPPPTASSSMMSSASGGVNDKSMMSTSSSNVVKELPLYCTGGYRFFWDTKFDLAMQAYLNCLQQLKEELDKTGTGCLPFKMNGDKIEDKGKKIIGFEFLASLS